MIECRWLYAYIVPRAALTCLEAPASHYALDRVYMTDGAPRKNASYRRSVSLMTIYWIFFADCSRFSHFELSAERYVLHFEWFRRQQHHFISIMLDHLDCFSSHIWALRRFTFIIQLSLAIYMRCRCFLFEQCLLLLLYIDGLWHAAVITGLYL